VEHANRLNGASITGPKALLPSPQVTIDLNTNATLTQNPGY
jgi:hypothetical protein